MVFCENGNYFPSSNAPVLASNVPVPTLSQLANAVQSGKTINRVYFAPNSDSYIVTDGNSVTAYQNPPADLWAAVQNLVANGGFRGGPALTSISWVGDGIWSAVGTAGYRLGANVPATVKTTIANEIQQGKDSNDPWNFVNLIFAPSGEWFLQGYNQSDQGQGSWDFSPNFPADIQALMKTLPNRVDVQNIEFDPDGGWTLVDDTNQVHYGGTIANGLQSQITTAQGGGQVVNDVATLALNCPIFPIGYPNPIMQPTTPNNFDVLQGAHGGCMQTQISMDSGGNIYGNTILQTSNQNVGFHGSVILAFIDFTGNFIGALQGVVAQRFGIDDFLGQNQNKPNPNTWTQNIGTGYLQQIRAITITHVYSPNSLEQDIQNWTQGIGSAVQNLMPVAQFVSTIMGSGGKSSGSGSSSQKSSG